MTCGRHRKVPFKAKGFTLIEILVVSLLMFILLVLIGSAYTGSVELYKRTDFQQIAQKTAGVILETMSREIRGSVRIEAAYNGIIHFPIDTNANPLWPGPSMPRALNPFVAFTNSASPSGQVNIFYHFSKLQNAIFYYTRPNPGDAASSSLPYSDVSLSHQPGNNMIRKFSSDGRVVIENFECWGAPDGVVIRVQLTDRSYTYDYDYSTDTARAGGENKFFKRPIVTQSVFISIRYYN